MASAITSRRIVAAIVVLLFLAGCPNDGDRNGSLIPEGDALDLEHGVGWGFRKIPPGQQVIVAAFTLLNSSNESIELDRVRFGATEGSAKIRLLKAEVLPRTGDATTQVPESSYVTYPPVSGGFGEACVVQDPEPLKGYVLEPETEVLLSLWIEVDGRGRELHRLDSVVYQQDEELRSQPLPYEIRANVKPGAKPLKFYEDRKCLKHAEMLMEL